MPLESSGLAACNTTSLCVETRRYGYVEEKGALHGQQVLLTFLVDSQLHLLGTQRKLSLLWFHWVSRFCCYANKQLFLRFMQFSCGVLQKFSNTLTSSLEVIPRKITVMDVWLNRILKAWLKRHDLKPLLSLTIFDQLVSLTSFS